MKTLDDSLDVSNIDDSYKEAVKCKVCDVENECVENIKKHMKFNHEHSKIICQKGDYVLENKPRVLKHMRVVHEVCKNEVSTNANKSSSIFMVTKLKQFSVQLKRLRLKILTMKRKQMNSLATFPPSISLVKNAELIVLLECT